jgi:hypothetical protein
MPIRAILILITISLALAACAGGKLPDDRSEKEKREEKFGKLFGDELFIFGEKNDPQDETSNQIINNTAPNVSPFLWNASLNVIQDMPLLQADRTSGIILTDWYQIPEYPNEQFKVDIVISSSVLRSDGISVSAFQKIKTNDGWIQKKLNKDIKNAIEETILNEARNLKVKAQ